MPITVSADGKSVVTTKSDGKANATIPDICKLPLPSPPGPIPFPFPNTTESKDCKFTSILTQFDGGQVACFGSYTGKSKGDKAGKLGGIISGKTEGKGIFLNCSSSFMVEGRPVVRKGDLMITNLINTVCLAGMNQKDVGEPEEPEKKTVKFALVDIEGKPMPDEPYIANHSGGNIIEGKSDASGYITIEEVTSEFCKIRLPDRDMFEFKIT